mgnify:CR=1 FL=1
MRFVEAKSIQVLICGESNNMSFESYISWNVDRSQQSIIEVGSPCHIFDPDTCVQIEGERVLVPSYQK